MRKFFTKNKGITIVALVVTIIVLIILAGISISTLMGENGLIGQAQERNKEQEIAQITETLKLKKMKIIVGENKETVTIDEYIEGVKNDENIEYEVTARTNIDEANTYITIDDKYEYLLEKKDDGELRIIYEGETKKLLPRIRDIEINSSTKDIEVKVIALRAEKYKYYIKAKGDSEYTEMGENTTGEYTFGNLVKNKQYIIKVEAINENGKVEKEVSAITSDMAVITKAEVKFISDKNWTNKNVITEVEINTDKNIEKYELQYAKFEEGIELTYEELEAGEWIKYTEEKIISEENETIYIRLSDGYNSTSYISTEITNIDKVNPQISTILSASNVTTKEFTLNVDVLDELSGIGKIEWCYKLNGASNYTKIEEVYTTLNGRETGEITQVNKTKEITDLVNGTYNVYAVVYDVAGNSVTSETIEITLVPIEKAEGATKDPTEWTNGDVTVTLPVKEGFITEYQEGPLVENGTWVEYSEKITVSTNKAIYYRYSDGKNAGEYNYIEITNIDKEAPKATSVEIKNVTATGYDVYVYGVTDSGSGVNRVEISTWTEENDIKTAKGTDQGNGTWYYRVNVTDYNSKIGTYNTKVEIYDNIENKVTLDTKTVNVPGVVITFDNNDGLGNKTTVTKGYNLELGALPTVTRTGYTFTGWYTAKENGTQITEKTKVPAVDTTYYAVWTVNTYIAEFKSNLIHNGQFTDGLSGWSLQGSGSAIVDTTVKNGTQNSIRVSTLGSTYDGIKSSYNVTYKTNTQYKITLKAYRDSSSTYGNLTKDLRVYLPEMNADGSTSTYRHYITINSSNLPDKTWKEFTATFTTFSSGANFGPLHIDFNAVSGTSNIWLADIKVEEVQTITKNYNVELGTLPTVTRTGYTFEGWFTGENGTGTQISTTTKMGASNVTYYAKWTPNTNTAYKVIHQQMSLDGTTYETVETENLTGTTNTTVTPAVKTYAGFTSPATQTVTIAADGSTTVTYRYTRNKYTVTFNFNGGTSKNSSTKITSTTVNQTYGGKYNFPTSPTRPGYTFAGWFTAASGGTQVTTNSTVAITAAQTLYAGWTVNSYTLTVNPNGGTWSSSTSTQTFTQNYNTTKTIANPTRTGYTFKGWALTKQIDGSNWVELMYQAPGYAGFTNEAGAKSANTVYLYSQLGQLANFKYNDKYEFIIEADENGKMYRWSQTSNPLTTTSVTGYTNISNGLGGLVYNNTSTLLAVTNLSSNWWSAIGMYDGTGTNPISNIDKLWTNRPVHLYVKAANDLSNLSSYTITGALNSSNNYIFRDENITLQAIWAPNTNTAYKVIHQQMGTNGTTYTTVATENLTGTTGASVTPAVKTYAGFTSPAKQTVTIAADGSTTVTYKYTRNKYTFTLGSAAGVATTGSSATGSYYYGVTINLKASASTGYTWSKWTSSNTSLVATTTTANTTFTMPAGNVSMTPSATENTYTIAFNANGGSGTMASITGVKYTAATTLTANAFTKTGYTFTGWATSASGSVVYANKASVSKLSATNGATVTLFAIWKDTTAPTVKAYAGAMLYTDPSFSTGNNSIAVYNNTGNGLVTHTRKAMSDNPAGSGYGIEIKTTGTAHPGHGGFYFGTPTAANAEYITRIVAKIPQGYTLAWASNAYGNSSTIEWLTSNAGTGAWQEYIFRLKCGSSGTFSSTNFYYLTGGSTATTSAPLTWQLGYATVICPTSWSTTNYIVSAGIDEGSKIVAYGINQSSTTQPTWSTFTANVNVGKISGAYTTNTTYYVWMKDGAGNVANTPVTLRYIDRTAPTVKAYAGKMLYTDPSFSTGNNSIVVYNNSANGLVTHTRKAMSDNPAGSGYGIEIKTTGAVSPGHGGFYFATPTAANGEYITRIVAKIPQGYTIEWASNAYGNSSTAEWLTSNAGTGAWQEYIFRVKCGSSGTFSSTNFYYLKGGSTATTSAPVTWQLGYATVICTTTPATTNYIVSAGTDTASKIVAYGINQSNTTQPTWSTFTANANVGKISGTYTTNTTYYVWMKDGAGNVANTPVTLSYIDRTAPTVTITANPSANPTNASSITYTFTWSENVTGFTTDDVTVANGTKGTFSGSGKTYTLVVTNSGTCTQTVSVAASKCTDAAGNNNTAASKSVTIDRTKPTVTLTPSTTGWTNGKVKVTASYTDNGTILSKTLTSTGTSGTDYTKNGTSDVTLITNGKTVTATATDSAGNTTTVSKTMNNIDPTVPTISTALSSSNVTTSGFTLNIGVTDTLSGLSKIIWYYKLSTASSYTSATDTYTTMNGATAGTKTAVTKTKAFSGLAAGTYNAYAVVYDVAGNSKQSSTITITMITQTVWNYGYTGGVQSFAVPVTGTYKLEVWGAKGGGNGGYGDDLGGGLGGYAKGNVKLTAGQTIYVVVGGTGTTGTYTSSGGYNGGGNRCYNGGGGGGGATHIGTRNGTLKAYGNTTGLYIVAGGGGGQGHYGSNSASGGYGGGTTGGEAAGKSGSSDTSYERGRGGTQTAGGTWTMCLSGGFGYGGNGSGATAGGGGGGLYGGSGGYSNNGQWAGGGGGSGYVGGCISGTTSMSNGQRSGHGYATITLVSY